MADIRFNSNKIAELADEMQNATQKSDAALQPAGGVINQVRQGNYNPEIASKAVKIVNDFQAAFNEALPPFLLQVSSNLEMQGENLKKVNAAIEAMDVRSSIEAKKGGTVEAIDLSSTMV